MKTFKDNAGRTWTVAINVAAIKRCRALVGVDLLGLADDGLKGLGKLLADPVGLVDVIYVLCKDEADRANVTDEDFGRAMAGDSIEYASDAFLAELSDFFQKPGVRDAIRRLIDASRRAHDRVMDHLKTRIDAIDPDDEARKLIASFGTSPDSSGSTPAPSPSESWT